MNVIRDCNECNQRENSNKKGQMTTTMLTPVKSVSLGAQMLPDRFPSDDKLLMNDK